MSNPGVIILKSTVAGKHTFKIEDNIGESIHLHFDQIRIDLTIEEFLSFASDIELILNSIIRSAGIRVEDVEPIFLSELGSKIIDLDKITYDEVYLSELLIDTKGIFNLPVVRQLGKSRVYKHLSGNSKENSKRNQVNDIFETNDARVEKIYNKMSDQGYVQDKGYITLFNNQNNICDGQHRAASLFFKDGDQKVKVVRYWFKNGKYEKSQHPWIHSLFRWNLRKCIRVLRIIYKLLRLKSRKIKMRVRYKLGIW